MRRAATAAPLLPPALLPALPLALLLTLAIPAGVASAEPRREKVREDYALATDLLLEGFCPFPVTTTDVSGKQTVVTTLDADGEVLRIDVTGPLRSTFTNTLNGRTIELNNSGPVTVLPQPDGSLVIVQRGRSLSGDQGLLGVEAGIRARSGRVVTTAVPNPTTGFLDFSSQTVRGRTVDVCALLA